MTPRVTRAGTACRRRGSQICLATFGPFKGLLYLWLDPERNPRHDHNEAGWYVGVEKVIPEIQQVKTNKTH